MKKLGTILEEAGVIDEIQLVRALSHQRKWRCRLGKSFVELGFVDEVTIAKTVSKQLGIPFREFNPKDTPAELLNLVPRDIAMEKGVFPVGYSSGPGGKTVVLAMSDPTDRETLLALEKSTGTRMEPLVAKDSAIEEALKIWGGFKAGAGSDTPAASSQPKPSWPLPEFSAKSLGANPASVEDEWPKEITIAESKPPPATAVPRQPSQAAAKTEDIFLKGFTPVAAGAPAAEKEHEELLTVSGLPPISEDDEFAQMGEVEHGEPWEHAMSKSEAATETAVPMESPEEKAPETLHSQPWEHTMPGVDAAAHVTELRAAPKEGVMEVEEAEEVGEAEEVEEAMPADAPTQVAAKPPPPQPAPLAQPKAPTLDEISGEVYGLKQQLSLLRKEMGILKEEITKIKRK